MFDIRLMRFAGNNPLSKNEYSNFLIYTSLFLHIIVAYHMQKIKS